MEDTRQQRIQVGSRVESHGKPGDANGWEAGPMSGVVIGKNLTVKNAWQVTFDDGGTRRRLACELVLL